MSFLFNGVFIDTLLKELRGEIFLVFLVLALGYLLGRITFKGVSLGSSGVFIIALAMGIFVYYLGDDLGIVIGKGITSTIKTLGLALFVTGVGFIAGPTFIRNFKKKAFSFITMGVCVVLIGTLMTIILISVDKTNLRVDTAVGLLMGALTSTPGLSSAQSIFAETSNTVAAASGLAYPFGVLGVVLFVQLMPKILRKDMNAEIEKMRASADKNVKIVDEAVVVENDMIKAPPKELFKLDSLGICVFSMAVALGVILGALAIPLGANAKFNLGITGGALIVGLLFGHFRHIGRVSLEVPKTTLNPAREIGLVFFLTGSGLEGGLKMFQEFGSTQLVIMLLYGALLTLVPMIAVYFIGRYLFKLELLNNLGSLTGGMTSTPALGALIYTAKTDDVAQSYAATYPIALFLLVLVPQVISWIFP